MDSTFKRVIFLVITIAIGVLLLYTAYFYVPELNQQSMVLYFLLVQALVLITFYVFCDAHAYRLRSVKKLKNPRLQENTFLFSSLLIEDYKYIRETLKQAMDDRHTMVNYFILITGGIVTITVSNLSFEKFQNPDIRYFLKLAVFILNFIGWIYFLHLIRLRQAWRGSALAMNQIKEFYIQNGRIPDDIARSAFLWDTKTVPAAGRKSNVFYYSALLISFVSSIFIVIASYISVPYEAGLRIPSISLFLGLYHLVFQMMCYSLFLDYSKERTTDR